MIYLDPKVYTIEYGKYWISRDFTIWPRNIWTVAIVSAKQLTLPMMSGK